MENINTRTRYICDKISNLTLDSYDTDLKKLNAKTCKPNLRL